MTLFIKFHVVPRCRLMFWRRLMLLSFVVVALCLPSIVTYNAVDLDYHLLSFFIFSRPFPET